MLNMASSKADLLPHSAATQNGVALFIFTIPMGTRNEDLFTSSIYRSVRNNIARKCHCELSVFDGNTLLPLSHSIPNRNYDQPPTDLLISIANPQDEILFTRGNWVIQVVYLTEPSRHYLFLKLINDFATKMKTFSDPRNNLGRTPISQGFKYTTVVTLAHEKLRDAFQGDRNALVNEDMIKKAKSQRQKAGKDSILPREWGELPTIKIENTYDDMRNPISNLKLQQSGDLMVMEDGNLRKVRERIENQFTTENNLNQNASCVECAENSGTRVHKNAKKESSLQTIEHELEGLAKKMNLE
ncbi:unnamed protein product [Rodentolepis nana]|uniref:Uncharacterized protein n=1 Tax=Rodentolepis nana TaxID=102285 RepID=A0A0R3T440_RODNA|nr:unnamed protein product [Rodentolepis nana]